MITYRYIDDSADVNYIDAYEQENAFEIKRLDIQRGSKVEEIRQAVLDSAPSGLLIDFRLDGEEDFQLGYKAPTLAQDIRTVLSEGEQHSFPIVAISTEDNLKNKIVDKDVPSHDLFDLVMSKDPKKVEENRKHLIALSKAYDAFRVSGFAFDWKSLLGRDDLSTLDARIFSLFDKDNYTSFEFISFLLKKVVLRNGILIDERMAAAHLGIDKEKSGDSWTELLNYLSEACLIYTGLLSDGWTRLWADKLDNWFEEISGSYLFSLDAKKRVDILIGKTGIAGLQFAEPIKFCDSIFYDTICEETGRPLDSAEGYVIRERETTAFFQNTRYLSAYAINEETSSFSPTAEEYNRYLSDYSDYNVEG